MRTWVATFFHVSQKRSGQDELSRSFSDAENEYIVSSLNHHVTTYHITNLLAIMQRPEEMVTDISKSFELIYYVGFAFKEPLLRSSGENYKHFTTSRFRRSRPLVLASQERKNPFIPAVEIHVLPRCKIL